MSLINQSVLFKILFLIVAYLAHGRPFVGLADYGYIFLVMYLLLFGVRREQIKPILVILGLTFLSLGHVMPQMEIPEHQRILMDEKHQFISPNHFLKEKSKYPFFMTADGYLQGEKEKRFVQTIDVDKGILSLRSGWINRHEFNFYQPLSPYVREKLPFVVSYGITPQMVGMTLSVEGIFGLDKKKDQESTLLIPDKAQKMILTLQDEHKGVVLYGFGGQWDDKGFNNLTIKLEKTNLYRFYDAARLACFFLGLGLLFLGFFVIRLSQDYSIQSFLLAFSAISFWGMHPELFRWGLMARGGMDGIIHDGYPYWMLEKWAMKDWGASLMSPEQVFYFMPGMRYVRFSEMLLFGDAYVLQTCLLIFVPIIFYRFFTVFLSRNVSILLTLLTFASLFNGIGLSQKLYINSLLDLYGEGFSYALLFIALTLLVRLIRNVGWGIAAFFLLSISISIRPNLAVFVGMICIFHLFTTTFSTQSLTSRFMMLFGLAPVLLVPLHNILGGEFVLSSKAAQIPENFPLSPTLYYQAICHVLGFNEAFNQMDKFVIHFKHVYPQYAAAWFLCIWISFKEKIPSARALALATFAGLSVHFFCWPVLRYLHPYLTIAFVLGLHQIHCFRFKEE